MWRLFSREDGRNMIAIIAGSRTITDQKIVDDVLEDFFKIRYITTRDVVDGKIISEEETKRKIPVITEVVSGCQKTKDGRGRVIGGVDYFGEQWARRYKIPVKEFPAQWHRFNKRAGPIRNKEMIEYVSKHKGILILIWDGKSRGSKDIKFHAENYRVKIHEYIR